MKSHRDWKKYLMPSHHFSIQFLSKVVTFFLLSKDHFGHSSLRRESIRPVHASSIDSICSAEIWEASNRIVQWRTGTRSRGTWSWRKTKRHWRTSIPESSTSPWKSRRSTLPFKLSSLLSLCLIWFDGLDLPLRVDSDSAVAGSGIRTFLWSFSSAMVWMWI